MALGGIGGLLGEGKVFVHKEGSEEYSLAQLQSQQARVLQNAIPQERPSPIVCILKDLLGTVQEAKILREHIERRLQMLSHTVPAEPIPEKKKKNPTAEAVSKLVTDMTGGIAGIRAELLSIRKFIDSLDV